MGTKELYLAQRSKEFNAVKRERRWIVSALADAADMLPEGETVSYWPSELLTQNRSWLDHESSGQSLELVLKRLGQHVTCDVVQIATSSDTSEQRTRPVVVLQR